MVIKLANGITKHCIRAIEIRDGKGITARRFRALGEHNTPMLEALERELEELREWYPENTFGIYLDGVITTCDEDGNIISNIRLNTKLA